jgi:hypothetical protein
VQFLLSDGGQLIRCTQGWVAAGAGILSMKRARTSPGVSPVRLVR